MRLITTSVTGALVLAFSLAGWASVADWTQGWSAATTPDVTLSVTPGPPCSAEFQSKEAGRHFVALQRVVDAAPDAARGVVIRYRLQCDGDARARMAVMAWDDRGNAWFRIQPRPAARDRETTTHIAMTSPRAAAFNDAAREFSWSAVQRVWLGVVVDGPASGELRLLSASLTSEVFHPTEPLPLVADGVSRWSMTKDAAVQVDTDTVDGPHGQPCMRVRFTMPGGRHMYLTPTLTVGEAEFGDYKALQFQCAGSLPDGIDGLLVQLQEEGGASYFASPLPPIGPQWKTITLPWKRFRLGSWTQDANNRLDLDQIRRVSIGIHGVAKGKQVSGEWRLSGVQLAP